jgi:ATP-dependent helicase HrpB
MGTALPIDEHLEPIAKALRTEQVLVLEATAGAGKTTRVPRFLVESGLLGDRTVVVSEPRRIAAKLAANFVATELGEAVGKRVGYTVRFEDVSSGATRIRYVTAGVLLRQLLDARALDLLRQETCPATPARLSNIGAIVLDEFHERQLETDQSLALLKSLLDRGLDLKLIVMSATLDADRLVAFLGGCPRIRSEGRNYPLSIEHTEGSDDRPLEKRVMSAVKSALGEQAEGHVLVFLPTVRDIEKSVELLREKAESLGVDVLSLHGEMPLAEQARAVAPSERRKVVLATNVAESSVTVPGVTAVIDSGLARLSSYTQWSGRKELRVAEISRASAIQRAGRAGRTAPGRVYRLFTKGSFQSRREQDLPEVQRADLSDAWLGLYGARLSQPERLAWMDAPPIQAVDAAKALLVKLGAIEDDGKLTRIGERMLRFGIHPRHARIIVAGEDLDVAPDACLAAALLGERDIQRRSERQAEVLARSDSDLLQRIDDFREAEHARFAAHKLTRMGLDRGAVTSVDRAYKKLLGLARAKDRVEGTRDEDTRLLQALLSGFPDRVARRRKPEQRDLILASGATAKLSPRSVVHRAPLLIALDLESRSTQDARSEAVVSLASAIEPEWLLDGHAHLLESTQSFEWNETKSQVDVTSRIACGSVILEESRKRASGSDEATRLLARALRGQKARFWGDANLIETFCARIKLVAEAFPDAGLPAFDLGNEEELLASACVGLTGFDEVEDVDWTALFVSHLGPRQQRLLAEHAPLSIDLAGGRRLKINYQQGARPWVSSRLQDFFGLKKGPAICAGRVPLTLHLLAPNQRAVQVTTDLDGFWRQHYPPLRRELMRRYPRHAWPEDPLTSSPPRPARKG